MKKLFFLSLLWCVSISYAMQCGTDNQCPLLQAAIDNNKGEIKKLLNKKNAIPPEHATGTAGYPFYLLPPTLTNKERFSLIHCPKPDWIRTTHFTSLKALTHILVQHGVHIRALKNGHQDYTPEKGRTAITKLAKCWDDKVCLQYQEHPYQKEFSRNRYKQTTLMWHILCNEEKLFQETLAKMLPSFYINATDIRGFTALDYAVQYMQFNMVQDLIRAGALVSSHTLKLAANNSHEAIFVLLIHVFNNKLNRLQQLALSHNTETVSSSQPSTSSMALSNTSWNVGRLLSCFSSRNNNV